MGQKALAIMDMKRTHLLKKILLRLDGLRASELEAEFCRDGWLECWSSAVLSLLSGWALLKLHY